MTASDHTFSRIQKPLDTGGIHKCPLYIVSSFRLFVSESQNRWSSFLDLQDHKTQRILFSLHFSRHRPAPCLRFTEPLLVWPLGTRDTHRDAWVPSVGEVVFLSRLTKTGGAAF